MIVVGVVGVALLCLVGLVVIGCFHFGVFLVLDGIFLVCEIVQMCSVVFASVTCVNLVLSR